MTIQTREIIVVHSALPECSRAQCAACGAVVTMVSPEEAARLARVTVRSIYRWVEAARVHYIESPGGRLRICAESLRR